MGSTSLKFMHTYWKEQGAEMQAKRRMYKARSSSEAGEGVSDQFYTT